MTGSDEDEELDSVEVPDVFDYSNKGVLIMHDDLPDWFTESDAKILSVLMSGLILSPSIIAENTGLSRVTVSRRLTPLQAAEMVKKIDRGKYEITRRGAYALTGDVEKFPDAAGLGDLEIEKE